MTRSRLSRRLEAAAESHLFIVVVVFVLALANRLVPVLKGAGLAGVLGYDDGVYYAGAVGLIHGRLPYRDFLILHPPGVLLALAPVATFGRWVGEVTGWEASRVMWMLMGCGTSLAVVRILLPAGRLAAAVGGCAYAVFPGAVLVERTTLLEGLTNLCLAAALALLIPQLARRSRLVESWRSRRWIVPTAVGCLLGFATTVKIWGVVPLTVVCVFAALVVGARYGLAIALGAAATITAVCLPFFVIAPAAMWRMVIIDQIGRDRGTDVVQRGADIITMGHAPKGGLTFVVVIVGVLGLVATSIVAWKIRPCRMAVAILLSMVGLLWVSPIFFPHYVGAVAVPIALVAGAVTARLSPRLDGQGWRAVAVSVGCVALVVDALALSRIQSGARVPAELAPAVHGAPGCITADDSSNLLALSVVGRNIGRGCELVVDLGGYSTDLSRGTAVSRGRNLQWQHLAVEYLGSGHYALVTRFSDGHGLSASTAAAIEHWPVRVRARGCELRQPT